MKSVGGLKTVVPQFGLVNVQPGVGVRLGDAVAVGVGVSDAVGVAVGVATGHVGLGEGVPGVGEPWAGTQNSSVELSGVTPSQV